MKKKVPTLGNKHWESNRFIFFNTEKNIFLKKIITIPTRYLTIKVDGWIVLFLQLHQDLNFGCHIIGHSHIIRLQFH